MKNTTNTSTTLTSKLITATITDVQQGKDSMYITARSLMGKYRRYKIYVSDDELKVEEVDYEKTNRLYDM